MKKYNQIKGDLQFLDDPQFYLDIRDFGEGPQVETISDGTYACPDNTDPSLKTFLRHVQRPTTVSDKEPPILISLVVYKAF